MTGVSASSVPSSIVSSFNLFCIMRNESYYEYLPASKNKSMILLSSSVTFLLLLYGSLPSNWEQCIVYHLFGGLFFSNQICRRELAFFPSLQINDVRKILGPIANKFPVLYSDASISRYLRARNWNTKKATKMLTGMELEVGIQA